MTYEEFTKSLSEEYPPKHLTAPLLALWYDARDQWKRAHQIVQDDNSGDAAWVHAYLHRKEGDLGNAQFWYSRAGKEAASGSLKDEWQAIAQRLSG
jgi:hypothetical protein